MNQIITKTYWYRGVSIQYSPWDWLYTVCFDQHECDYQDYGTYAQAKRAIDRWLKDCGE